MPPFGAIKRRDLIRYLRQLGFEGPYPGEEQGYMLKAKARITIPNPHRGDISKDLLTKILRQFDISRDQWEQKHLGYPLQDNLL